MAFKIEKWSHVPFYWSVTAATLRRVLEARFDPADVSVEAHGNVHTAAAFLYGLALEDLHASDFDVDDAAYPVTVAGYAVKRPDARDACG